MASIDFTMGKLLRYVCLMLLMQCAIGADAVSVCRNIELPTSINLFPLGKHYSLSIFSRHSNQFVRYAIVLQRKRRWYVTTAICFGSFRTQNGQRSIHPMPVQLKLFGNNILTVHCSVKLHVLISFLWRVHFPIPDLRITASKW